MKVAIYLRVSTEEQDANNQLRDCLSINRYGEAIEFRDNVSAWKDNVEREDFERLKKLIKSNEINHLIVWDFDRIYRNRNKFKQFLQFLKVYNVKLHSYRQQWLEEIHKVPEPWNEMFYDFFINMFGWIAEEESKKKSDRTKIAHKSGKHKEWGRPSLPYSAQKEILILNNQGKSLRDISKEVYYWDKNNNKKRVSLGIVHKIIKENKLNINRNEVVQ